jgi:hypothetical protein
MQIAARALLALLLTAGFSMTVTAPRWPASAATGVLDIAVAAGSDDAEESASGSVSLSSSDLELVQESSAQTVGIRFRGVVIPKGATITAAWIQFTTDELKSGSTALSIRGQAVDNAATFTTSSRNVSSRARTTASVAWAPVPWTVTRERGPSQRTPNVSPVLQEIVSRAGWASGNAIAFVITGTGVRTAGAHNGGRPPALHVEYATSPPPNQPPAVAAGADATIRLPASASLAGIVTDDGLPSPPGALATSWGTISGPGIVTFANSSVTVTTATFAAPGDYVLRLTASDGAAAAADDVTITVLAPDALPPTAPTGLSVTAATGGRIDVAWAASVDDVGVVDYVVLRDDVPIATSTATSYTELTSAAATTYVYRVVARDAAGNTSEPSEPASITTPAAPDHVVFAAAGDHGAGDRATASLAALDASEAEFYLAVGDLDYNDTPTDAAWCDYVTTHLVTKGPSFPFELVSGNHESQGSSTGYIMEHAACLPDRMASTVGPGSVYGAEYSFDYPVADPLVRVIMLSPGLTIENNTINYLKGDPHYGWLSDRIDGARTSGIPWVVVGMHYPCYSAGRHSCGLSSDLLNLLVNKRVDLVLSGHDHNYQRSKQLATDASTCPVMPIAAYDPDCVADDGADETYVKGAGSVFMVAGTFGRGLYAIEPAQADYPYFARADATSWGFVEYTVTEQRLHGRFVASSGSFGDRFEIVPDGTDQPVIVDAGSDQVVALSDGARLTGSVRDDGLPDPPGATTSSWSAVTGPGAVTFADPLAPSTSATFSDVGTYVLRLTGSDGATTRSDDVTVIVNASGHVTTIALPVIQGSDDAEESPAGAVSRSSSDLELVSDGSVVQTVGMRFSGVPIPAGALIANAWVQFQTDEAKSVATSLVVRGQAADHAATFSSTAFGISSRPTTAASVAWSPATWTVVGERGPNQRTPPITAVVQEIVSRAGWTAGNALALIVRGTGVRTAEAFDGTAPPVLHVEYTVP